MSRNAIGLDVSLGFTCSGLVSYWRLVEFWDMTLPRKSYRAWALRDYRRNARRGGWLWGLDAGAAADLLSGDCHYCGGRAKTRFFQWQNQTYESKECLNGIDRLDSSLGYIPSNCVSCCSLCNRLKGPIKFDMFINHIKLIFMHIWSRR